MSQILLKDGTRIAFDRTGHGPAVIMVNGALGYRGFYGGGALAARLSTDFTFIDYDRRGRGDSTDMPPYAVDREIEDIEALVDEAGGSACLYGISSGACLALLAAAKLGSARVERLALYEPPYGSSDEREKQAFADQRRQIEALIEQRRRGDAVALFIADTGATPGAIEEMRKTPDWNVMEGVEHTLAYDYAVLGDGSVPLDLAETLTMPTLVLDGSETYPFMHEAADTLGRVIPGAVRKTLGGQTHEVSPDALAPVLREFFLRGSG